VQELKRTAYKPKTAILAAKRHYCINQVVLNSDKGVDTACEDCMSSSGGCAYRKNVGRLVEHVNLSGSMQVGLLVVTRLTCAGHLA
jgi:hypothetical protein